MDPAPQTMTFGNPDRRQFLRTLGGSLAAGAIAPAQTPEPPMNFVFLLIDDLGWHDTGPYGNKVVETPHLDRLARESARFTNAYAACPVCSPTRASILTGKYPARLGLTDWIPGRRHWQYSRLTTPAFAQQLPLAETTVAEALKTRGYTSAAIGKWHLGGSGFSPTDQGFDVNVAGTAAGSPPTYFGPLELPNLSLRPGEFLTEHLTRDAIGFMDRHANAPFFLYHANFTVHIPLQAPADLVAKYKARNTGEMDPTYCAMVETADQAVGSLLKTIDSGPLASRTAVIFFSDNGGVRFQNSRPKPVTDNSPLRAGKGHVFEGGIREPLLVRWPGVTRPGSVIDTPVSSIDFFPTLTAAASASHGPVDGVDIRPLLRGGSIAERPLFWHYPHYSDQGGRPAGAVRLGEWKLIEFFEDGHQELYHLPSDQGEKRNLIEREKDRARKLYGLLKDWRASVKAAMPVPNPQYDPARWSEGLTGYEEATPPWRGALPDNKEGIGKP
ncbi:MAG TPA: sulfatase [Bryobacteraceae bacterium]|nr:sulfatase [Bryobacteraceae bacterium]